MSATANLIHFAPGVAARATVRGGGWAAAVLHAFHVIEGRRLLAQMDDRMLADIGVSRAEAQCEAARAPWDLEPSRRG